MSHKRWYDLESHLSQVVRAMEFMNETSQVKFGERLFELSEELILEKGGSDYLANLSDDVKAGLEKANSKSRWYDRHEKLHLAFKNLYSLPNSERRQIAVMMVTPIKIVRGYEKHCKNSGQVPDSIIVDEILRTCLTSGPKRAENLYQIYLVDASHYEQSTGTNGNGKGSKEDGVWSELLTSIQKALTLAS